METFFDAYVTCALWSSTDESNSQGGEPLDANYSAADIDAGTLAEMREHCERFQSQNAADIDGNEAQAGHDFWLTRNGHGAGFWDGDWDEPYTVSADFLERRLGVVGKGKRLTAASPPEPVVSLWTTFTLCAVRMRAM
jgi:hypothetical protein